MKINTKFTLYNIIMLIAPILMIGVISVCFLLIFIFKYPVEELDISRAALLEPAMFARALGNFFTDNPGAIGYIIIYIVICISLLGISMTIATRLMTRSVKKPIEELTRAAEYIRGGNLDFEVLGSDCDEIDTLCTSFDDMRRSLKQADAREKRMKKERSMLLANISHDLKTPVTSIKGYIEGIRDGVADTPEKMNRYLDTISNKADTINDMVNNLSTFSKLEMSRLVFNMETVDIFALVSEFAESNRLGAEEKNVKLTNSVPKVPATVKADKEQIARVFANLFDNAVKYGGTEIEVGGFIRDNGAYVTIVDNGIGMEEKDIKNVFESFYRADASRSIKGSGLGLGIVRQIAEKHSGKVWLKSDGVGKGTTATVYLPLITEGK